ATYCLSQLRVTFIRGSRESSAFRLSTLDARRSTVSVSWKVNGGRRKRRRVPGPENIGDGRRGSGKSAVIIFTQQGGNGGRDLTQRDGRSVGPLAQRRRVRAEDRDPVVLRASDFLSVAFPFLQAGAAPMVGRDDEGRFAAILSHRLNGLPKPADEI